MVDSAREIVLPIEGLTALIKRLTDQHDKLLSAKAMIGRTSHSVENLEIVYKDAYSRRSPDSIAARAIKDVMSDAAERAEIIARQRAEAIAKETAVLVESLRSDICNEAARACIALGVYARRILETENE